jgi:hypothetical protein
MIVWTLAGRPFQTAQEIIQYLESLPQVEQVRAIEALRTDFTRFAVQGDQMMHDIYAWLIERSRRGEMSHPDTREAWSFIRGGYLRVRQREREGRTNLAGEDKWCTEAFWDEVVAPLTGATKDVADVLRQIRAKGTSPIEALQRGCMEMFRRLSGGSQARTRKDLHCTGGDLRVGNIEKPSTDRLDQTRIAASGLGVSLYLDEFGFLWHQPPTVSIGHAVHQQRNRDSERAAEQAGKERAAKTSKAKEPTDESEDTATTPSLQGGPASNLRKRAGKAKIDATPIPSPKDRRTPPIKKLKREEPSPGAKQTAELDRVFRQLNVVNTKTSRRRASSLRQQGLQESEALSPDRMQIPVKNSTQTQRAIWEVIEKRVKGIKFHQQVDISKEAAAAMNLPPAQLIHEIEPIAAGLAQTSVKDDTLLAYTQCLLDSFRAQIVTRKGQTSEMAQLRRVVATWHRRFRGSTVTLIPGSMWTGGVQLDHYDVASLLLGDGYDGWLNGDLIYAVLTVLAVDHHVVPTRAFDFWRQGNHANNMFDVPGNFPSLIIPVHWVNHWALLIADRETRSIHYLDSMETPERRQMAVASMRNFLNMHPGYNQINWQESSWRSTQQTNNYDCGVWAIENAWAWMERRPRPDNVGVTNRLEIGQAILASAEVANEAPQPVPTDEVEYLGMRNLSLTPMSRAPIATPSRGQSFASAMQTLRVPSRGATPQRDLLIQTARAARQLGSASGPSTRPASTSTSRLATPQLDQMINDAAQILHTSNPATPAARSTTSSPLSSTRSSQIQTPPSMRQLINTGRGVTARGSPMPRTPVREEAEREDNTHRRGTRSGREF